MSKEELKKLEDCWKNNNIYKDVVAHFISNCKGIVKKCPNGCNLKVHKPNNSTDDWNQMPGTTYYKKTIFCRQHGYARIYVISEKNYFELSQCKS